MARAALRGIAGDVNYAMSATALSTDGTNVSRFGSEDDGYRNRTLYARAAWAPVTGASLDGSVRYRDSRGQFDPQDFGFPPGPTFGLIVDGDRRSEGDQLDVQLRARLATGSLEHQLGFARTQTEEDTFADSVFSNGFEGERSRFDYQGTWHFGGTSSPQALTVGCRARASAVRKQGTDAGICAKPDSRQ